MTTEEEESRKKADAAGWAEWKARTAEECLADWYDSDPEREQKEKEAKRGLRKSPKPKT